MNKIYAFIRHNSCIILSTLCVAPILIYAYSCESSVVSLVNSDIRITRAELVIEIDAFLAAAELRFADLDRQDFVKDTIFNSVLDLAQGKSVDPIGVAIAIAGILGLGAVGDNIRKRTHINTLKGGNVNAK